MNRKKDNRTYAQRREYLIAAVKRRRREVRALAIASKGGKCALCGYSRCQEALELHHPDPAQKEFGISANGYTQSWEKIRTEVDKCVLMCPNCHREVHAGLQRLGETPAVKSGEFRETLSPAG